MYANFTLLNIIKKAFGGIVLIIVCTTVTNAQTLEELNAQKAMIVDKSAPVMAQAEAYKVELEAIDAKIAKLPGWYKGIFGTLGANFSGRNNWFAALTPTNDLSNSRSTNIGGSFNAFANNLRDKYFWRNSASLNLGWQKLVTGIEAETPGFQPVSDILNITSLYGYKLSSKIAASALGEYRTSVIENFNNPGYLDFGVGVTYTPTENMIFVFHPINYNFIFTKTDNQFTSSLGCKIVGDYRTEIVKGVNWRTNLTGFVSYKNADPSLHNTTWTNWIGFNIFNGIGVGFEFGLRYSEQEIKKTQSYYTLGLTYKI